MDNITTIISLLIVIIVIQILIFSLVYRTRCLDPLTGLLNANAFSKRIAILAKRKKLVQSTAVFLNIKNFKYVNHLLGHLGGDDAVIKFGHRLKSFVGKGEMIARLGGDNFVALINDDRIGEFLRFISESEYLLNGEYVSQKIKLHTRCGVYSLKDNDGVSELMGNSSVALTYAREEKKDIVWFDDNIAKTMYREKAISYKFKEALKERQFEVYYQPKVDIQTNCLVGAEAIVRWNYSGQCINPVRFIPALEKNALIKELDFYVLEQVCKDIGRWTDLGMDCVRISSNFSKLNLNDLDFASNLLEVVERNRTDHKLLEIELTETANNDDYEAFKRFVVEMNSLNISTAIDDFGIGFSSLELLKNPNISVIKLDKSFIDDVEVNGGKNDNCILIKNAIRVCNELNKSVVCEGVENETQVKLLKELGCRIVQGYYFDKPLPVSDFEARLTDKNYYM